MKTESQTDVSALHLDPIIVGKADNGSNAAANQRLPESEVPPMHGPKINVEISAAKMSTENGFSKMIYISIYI